MVVVPGLCLFQILVNGFFGTSNRFKSVRCTTEDGEGIPIRARELQSRFDTRLRDRRRRFVGKRILAGGEPLTKVLVQFRHPHFADGVVTVIQFAALILI